MALRKRTEGVYSEDTKSGTLVYDNPEGTGEPLKDFVFEAYGKEYETDGEGKLVETGAGDVNDEEPKTEANGFVNPLTPGVSYADFIKSVPEGTSAEDHLTSNGLDSETVKWLVREVADFQNTKK